MIDQDVILRIEEAAFNAWPALNVLLYDGWLLRFANGYTKRANSVNGLYQSQLPLVTKIKYCETIFVQQSLPPIFRLTPLIDPHELDQQLHTRGYKLIHRSAVHWLDLQEFAPVPNNRTVILTGPQAIDDWLFSFHDLNPQRQDVTTHKQMLQRTLGSLCLMVLPVNNRVVACGLAVAEGDYLGLFDIVTAVDKRRRGYGLEITTSLLAWGQSMQARYAYLQVMKHNHPATSLYHGLGFQELYTYWYRVAAENWRRKL